MRKMIALFLLLLMLLPMAFAEEEAPAERTVATEFSFTANPDEEQHVENLIFNEDVVVDGVGANVWFQNCEFNGNVILKSESYTWVWIMGCVFNGDAHCIVDTGISEATIDYNIPKFVLFDTVLVECEGLGGAINFSEGELDFNGATYALADMKLYENPDGELVEYDGTQEVSGYTVIQWFEGGERHIYAVCFP